MEWTESINPLNIAIWLNVRLRVRPSGVCVCRHRMTKTVNFPSKYWPFCQPACLIGLLVGWRTANNDSKCFEVFCLVFPAPTSLPSSWAAWWCRWGSCRCRTAVYWTTHWGPLVAWGSTDRTAAPGGPATNCGSSRSDLCTMPTSLPGCMFTCGCWCLRRRRAGGQLFPYPSSSKEIWGFLNGRCLKHSASQRLTGHGTTRASL